MAALPVLALVSGRLSRQESGRVPVQAAKGPATWAVVLLFCVLIVACPWLIPPEARLLRFIASIAAAVLVIKVIDAAVDLTHGRTVSWQDHLAFLVNPFTHVRRCLPLERQPAPGENRSALALSGFICAIALVVLQGLFRLDWSGLPFLAEHAAKAGALMAAITAGLRAAAALWRLTGGTAHDFMDRPFTARTPAEFWRRYNRNVHQFFWQDVVGGSPWRRSPIRAMLLVFGLSALLHELVFWAAVGRVQGYQAGFFVLQGLAAAGTARIKVKGWRALPWLAGTLTFNLMSSVLFFASINGVVPFYSRALPAWLRDW